MVVCVGAAQLVTRFSEHTGGEIQPLRVHWQEGGQAVVLRSPTRSRRSMRPPCPSKLFQHSGGSYRGAAADVWTAGEASRAEAQAARGRARQHGGLWGDLLHDPSRPGSLWGLGLPGGAMVRSRTTATCRGCKSRNIPGIHNLLQYQEVIPLTV